MNNVRTSLLVITLTVFLIPIAFAGQLSVELEERIAQSRGDQMIPVWIKLYRLEPVNNLKARASRESSTRAGRHQFVARQLIDGHQAAQVSLVDHLSGMRKRGVTTGIKQYWIANVVAAQIRASELTQLAEREDIEWIYPVIEPGLIAPTMTPDPLYSPEVDSIAPNLTYINAPQAWASGYTGTGRLICSFDTGVDGDHPAIFNQWKGHDGDSSAAWFDPRYGGSYPEARDGYHGTHTMGIMVGYDTAEEYRIGVAPGAKWISAAVINVAGASVIDAFQWAADPDGNPNSVEDVPDVINHSWGYSKTIVSCENMVFDLIDNLEALGIVNVFASGNRNQQGAEDVIVFNPANRDLTPIDCFAVGNIDANAIPATLYESIVGGSLGGPSDCNGGIKPNAVAPGTTIHSSVPGGGYGNSTGTSMAAPHVSGLVALMRQKNPNATPDEIKTAIINSTQSDGSWGSLPNNKYGYGAIDCVAALAAIGTNTADAPSVRLYDFTHPPVSPGDTVTGTITLQNLGMAAINVSASITGTDPSLNVIDGSVSFGTIPLNGSVTSIGTVSIAVSDTVTTGSRIPIQISIDGDNVSTTANLYVIVGDIPEKGIANHDNGTIQFSAGNYGVLGLGSNSMYRAGGYGFTYNSITNDLWEGGIMIGTGPTVISSGIHSYFDRPDMDFKVIPGGDVVSASPGPSAEQESWSAFNDDWSTQPIGLTIRQHSFSYPFPNDDFVVLRYTLENFSGSAINGLYFGVLLDWDIAGASSSNAGGYDNPNGILWMAYNNGSVLSKYRGMKTLQGTQSGALIESAVDVSYLKIWLTGADGFTDAEKWTALIAGNPSLDPYGVAQTDLFQMMNFGPYNLAHGDIDSITVAILAGNSLAELQAAADAALLVPTDVHDDDPSDVLPTSFALKQNYPNPFNPSTVIQFDLPEPAQYELAIFNILGQTVHEETGFGRAGTVSIEWEAGDQPSGVYFYRVKTDHQTASRKMVLLK